MRIYGVELQTFVSSGKLPSPTAVENFGK